LEALSHQQDKAQQQHLILLIEISCSSENCSSLMLWSLSLKTAAEIKPIITLVVQELLYC